MKPKRDDGEAKHRHQGEGSEEGHYHAKGDPDNGLKAKEEADADEDQDEAALGILQQQVDAAFDDLGAVLPVVEPHAVGQARVGAVDIGLHSFGNVDGILAAFALDVDGDAALAVEAGDEGILIEAVGDLADLAER
jgi:hypothetical protein